eukprot:Trichotokara_eunicae@DN2124_c0_g1_i3.p2
MWWDGYLATFGSYMTNNTMIDATQTVRVLHQSEGKQQADSNYAVDESINAILLQKMGILGICNEYGGVTTSQYQTSRSNKTRLVRLAKRGGSLEA